MKEMTEAEGWITHTATADSGCPVDGKIWIEVRRDDGATCKGAAHDFLWDKSLFDGSSITAYREVAATDPEGWIEHTGKNCPVDDNTMVEVHCERSGTRGGRAYNFRWDSEQLDRILAYRVVQAEKKAEPETVVWDGEGLPPVGVECLASTDDGETWHSWETAMIDEGVVLFGYINGNHVAYGMYDRPIFQPLLTPAERQREAALKAMIAILQEGTSTEDDANNIYEAIAAGKIPGVTLTQGDK